MKDFLVKFLSTSFLVGYFPKAPGTVSSFLILAVVWFLFPENQIHLVILAVILLLINILITKRAEEIFGEDSRKIVLDESLGMVLSLLWIQKSLLFYFLAFILFRAIDVIKPFPIRELEKIKGGWGVMLDDFLAGVYTNFILQLFMFIY